MKIKIEFNLPELKKNELDPPRLANWIYNSIVQIRGTLVSRRERTMVISKEDEKQIVLFDEMMKSMIATNPLRFSAEIED